MTPYAKASDHYLVQRVMGASPEQLVALLLEGAQRFLAQAMQAIGRKDFAAKGHALNKTTAIVEELMMRLDLEGGGEVAGNLFRLYDWWGREIVEAGAALDARRLEHLSRQMGEIKGSWEQAYQQRVGAAPGSGDFKTKDLVG